MRWLARHERTVFVGQSVAYDGATIYDSLDGVPEEKRLEMPVVEEFQMGYCIGMSLCDIVPISIYPRIDFLLLALNQLVNHLDKLPSFGWRPKVIVRTRVGSKWPLNAGPQHTQNHSMAIRAMLDTVNVIEVCKPYEVQEAYQRAYLSQGSFVIVENPL